MVDLLKENHRRWFSRKKMEQGKKRNLLVLINDYRLIKEDDLMFHIRMSMGVRPKKWS